MSRFVHVVDEQDVRRMRDKLEMLENSDIETQRRFYIAVGLFDENGIVPDRYQKIFPNAQRIVRERYFA